MRGMHLASDALAWMWRVGSRVPSAVRCRPASLPPISASTRKSSTLRKNDTLERRWKTWVSGQLQASGTASSSSRTARCTFMGWTLFDRFRAFGKQLQLRRDRPRCFRRVGAPAPSEPRSAGLRLGADARASNRTLFVAAGVVAGVGGPVFDSTPALGGRTGALPSTMARLETSGGSRIVASGFLSDAPSAPVGAVPLASPGDLHGRFAGMGWREGDLSREILFCRWGVPRCRVGVPGSPSDPDPPNSDSSISWSVASESLSSSDSSVASDLRSARRLSD